MKAHNIRELSVEEISNRLTTWEEELFRARCNNAIGQLSDPNTLKSMRRDIARAKTILNEKKNNAASEK